MPSTENHLFCHSINVKEIDYTKLNQVNLGAGGRGDMEWILGWFVLMKWAQTGL